MLQRSHRSYPMASFLCFYISGLWVEGEVNEDWKNILQFISQTHLGKGVKWALSNICAIISLRQDQAPGYRLGGSAPTVWHCQGTVGRYGPVKEGVAVLNRWRSSNRLPGDPAAPKWCLQTCRQSLQPIFRSLFLCKHFGKTAQINWQVVADDIRYWLW